MKKAPMIFFKAYPPQWPFLFPSFALLASPLWIVELCLAFESSLKAKFVNPPTLSPGQATVSGTFSMSAFFTMTWVKCSLILWIKKHMGAIIRFITTYSPYFFTSSKMGSHRFTAVFLTCTSQRPRWLAPALIVIFLPAMSSALSHLTCSGPSFFTSLIRPHKLLSTQSWRWYDDFSKYVDRYKPILNLASAES